MPKFKPFSYLWLGLISLLYLATRIQNLVTLPVFGDEAIYVRWAQLIKNVETLRFIPLTDGKQPLFMWIGAGALKFFSDPLFANRLVSVFAGLGLVIVIYFFCLYFFNQKTAFIAAILYLVLPFTFFFDRMALADTLLSFFGILSLFLAVLLAKYPRLDISLLLGFALGFAWLTKSPALYFIALTFVTFILFQYKNPTRIYLPTISAFVGFMIYNILRLGPQFHQIALRNQDYVWSLGEILKHPLDPFIPHLRDIFIIYGSYISWPILIIFLVSLILVFKKLSKQSLILFVCLLWWILPLLANAAIAKVFTARYILFTLPPLIILMSVVFDKILQLSKYLWVILIISIVPNLYFISQLSLNPFHQTLPATEIGYLQDWTSGWGIKPAADYLISRSHSANVIVGTEGAFGTLPDGLQIYADGVSHLTIFGVGLDNYTIPGKLEDAYQHGDEVYVLLNQSRNKFTIDATNHLKLIASYPKPGNDSLQLFQLIK